MKVLSVYSSRCSRYLYFYTSKRNMTSSLCTRGCVWPCSGDINVQCIRYHGEVAVSPMSCALREAETENRSTIHDNYQY